MRSAPKSTSRSLKIGLCRQTPAARSTTPGRPTQTPEMSDISRSASLTQRRTPSSTRSAMTGADCRSMRIGSVSDASTSAQKLVDRDRDLVGRELHADDVGRVRVELQHDARPSARRRRARRRPAAAMMSLSSSSAAVIAETVVALNSVNCEISTRDTGPKRRIASMTWKRLIARINSGSAVFIAPGASRVLFIRVAELISSRDVACQRGAGRFCAVTAPA